VLQSDVLSIGPKIEEYEKLVAKLAGRRHGVGSAPAPPGPCMTRGIGRGMRSSPRRVLVCRLDQLHLYVGATPVFVDIDPQDAESRRDED